jgi:hypothetical protein
MKRRKPTKYPEWLGEHIIDHPPPTQTEILWIAIYLLTQLP